MRQGNKTPKGEHMFLKKRKLLKDIEFFTTVSSEHLFQIRRELAEIKKLLELNSVKNNKKCCKTRRNKN